MKNTRLKALDLDLSNWCICGKIRSVCLRGAPQEIFHGGAKGVTENLGLATETFRFALQSTRVT